MTLHQELKMNRPFLSPEEETALAIIVTRARFEEMLAAILERHGITRPQFNILRILRGSETETMTCSALNERMIERNPDLTRLLDRLEEMRYVSRERGREDRRRVLTRITDQGKGLLKVVDKEVLNLEKRIMSALTGSEIRTLNLLLEKVRESIRAVADTV